MNAEATGHYLRLALEQARLAQAAGEVPVGAVVVHQGRVVGTGHNACIAQHDPSAHAEVLALRAAGQALGNYRLSDCDLYVSLEPCAMCAAAMAHARIRHVVYGAADDQAGAAGSRLNVLADAGFKHRTSSQNAQDLAAIPATLKAELRQLLPDFFQAKRRHHAQRPWPLAPQALRSADLAQRPWPGPTGAFFMGLAPCPDWRLYHWDLPATTDSPLPPLLLLHDADSQLADWASHLPQWQGQRRILGLDLPGFGRSDKPKKAPADGVDFYLSVLRHYVQQQLGDAAAPLQLALLQPQHLLLPELARQLPQWLALAPLIAAPSASPPDRPYADWPFADAGHRACQRAWHATAKAQR